MLGGDQYSNNVGNVKFLERQYIQNSVIVASYFPVTMFFLYPIASSQGNYDTVCD